MTNVRGEQYNPSDEYLRPIMSLHGERTFQRSVHTNCLINRSAGVGGFVLTYTVVLSRESLTSHDPAAAAEQY